MIKLGQHFFLQGVCISGHLREPTIGLNGAVNAGDLPTFFFSILCMEFLAHIM
jgi:hypothetical protein